MKTLKTLAAALLATISLNAFAEHKTDGRNNTTSSPVIAYPSMNWGEPEDVYSETVISLRNLNSLSMPEMIWGSPDDVQASSIELLKKLPLVEQPAMVWGNPEDVNTARVEALKQR